VFTAVSLGVDFIQGHSLLIYQIALPEAVYPD
jgi:hypothetical protein